MPERLFAHFSDPRGPRTIGVFSTDRDGGIGFQYLDDDLKATPVSLSLPRQGAHAPQSAANYLANLLPDRPEVRQRWGQEAGVDPGDVMGLLTHFGEDVAGAISLSPDESLPARKPEALYEADPGEVALRIRSLREDEASWHDPRVRPRMSLGGQQGKFAVVHEAGRWFWPTYETPSTHIVKPPSVRFRGVEHLESAALDLARALGIASSRSAVAQVQDQQAFMVERWDRVEGFRLHAEDMVQALGVPRESKYRITAPQVVEALRGHGIEPWAFLRQLAFNV